MGLPLTFAVALGAALVLTPVARRVSCALGVLDRPGPLKTHREPVAYLGGAAVFVALAAALAVDHPAWLVPLGLATSLGVADDIRTISPRVRLLAQIAVGCIAGAVVPALGPAGWLVTAGLVVVLVNGVNLIDGMDGLASSVVAVSALGFALLGGEVAGPALATCGALAGFLVFNRAPARIYLGDGGAYLLGAMLALIAATALDGEGGAAWVALPLLIGFPLFDLAIAVTRRAYARRPLLQGDRSHVYDQLADRGWSVNRVVSACAAAQVVAVAAGLLVWHLGTAAAIATVAACAVAGAIAVWRIGFVTERAAA